MILFRFLLNYHKALNHPSKIYNIIIVCARNLPTTLTHNAYHHHSASNGLISPYKWWVVRVPKIRLFQVFYIKSENAFEELAKILPSIFGYPTQSLIYTSILTYKYFPSNHLKMIFCINLSVSSSSTFSSLY